MSFDLELFLVIGVVLTGLVWLADIVWLAPRRKAVGAVSTEATVIAAGRGDGIAKEPWYTEYSRSFFPVLLVVLVLRSFVAEPFRIPSGSMLPTLEIGDFILVNKFSYGLRLPVLNAKILEVGEPRRGDVMVFRYPDNPSVDYIKRVIGLPGDHIAYYGKALYINGKPMSQSALGKYVPDEGAGPYPRPLQRRQEDLGGVRHDILIMEERFARGEGEYVVPPGHYFVMGDNRDNSNDSRFWGPVPEENLVGRAMVIWMNLNFDFSRIGTSIH